VSNCQKLLNELSNFLDNELAPDLREELEKHIAKCPQCYVVFDSTKKPFKFSGGCDPYELPETLHRKLQEAVRKQYEDSSRNRP